MEKTRLTTAAKVFIAAMLVVAVVLAQFFLLPWLGFGADREMSIVGTGRGVNYDFDSGAAFHSNDSRFFYFVTREGVRYIQASNEVQQWHHPFGFNSPLLVARGDIVAVGEDTSGRGRSVYVFNANGYLFSVTMDNPILSFGVNEAGFLSVIVQYDGGYGIYVFNRYLSSPVNPLFHWDEFHDLIKPTHAEVSPDGRYIVIAVVDLNFDVRTTVQFRYFNLRDIWGTDEGLFATQEFPGQMVTAMQFMEGNRLVIATTSQITGFRLRQGHPVSINEKMWEIELENQKSHIEFYNGTHFSFVTGERLRMTAGEGDPLGTVRIYGINGQPTGRFELGRRATHLRMGHDAVIVGGDRSFHAMDFRGTPLWAHTSLFDTRDVLFLDNRNTILVAGSSQAEIFERRRVRDYEIERADRE
jgi:hypothetical protein